MALFITFILLIVLLSYTFAPLLKKNEHEHQNRVK